MVSLKEWIGYWDKFSILQGEFKSGGGGGEDVGSAVENAK